MYITYYKSTSNCIQENWSPDYIVSVDKFLRYFLLLIPLLFSDLWVIFKAARPCLQSRYLRVNPFIPLAAKTTWLFWWYFSNKKQWLENIWRRVVWWNLIYNSPSNSLQINASLQSYFQKYDGSRRHSSSRSQGMNGLKEKYSLKTEEITDNFALSTGCYE